MPKSSSDAEGATEAAEADYCLVTDPAVFVKKLQAQRGRTVKISADMQGLYDDVVGVDDEPTPLMPYLSDEGRQALRKRAIAAFLELQSVVRESVGVFDMSTPRPVRALLARMSEMEMEIGAQIDAAHKH